MLNIPTHTSEKQVGVLGKKKSGDEKDKTTPQQRAWRQKREFDLEWERSNHLIAVLTEQDFKEIIGLNWAEVAITQFDVSSEKYQLEVLGGMSGGLLHPDLKRYKLKLVDVSFNRLRNIDIFQESNGFVALTVLMARRNTITSPPKLSLPTLLELNLSHNNMKSLPNLLAMPLLQIFIISHNKLVGTFEHLKLNSRLKRIDLAYNNYELTPAQLSSCLDALADLRVLSNLRLYENPFVAYMKEYQVFVVQKLPGLVKLDNADITVAMRDELLARDMQHEIGSLEKYEDLLEHRRAEYKQEQAARQNVGREEQKIESLPQFNRMVVLLEDIMEDSSCLLDNVRKLMEFAGAISDKMHYSESDMNSILLNFWTTYSSTVEREAAIDHFLELMVGMMERHDTVRSDLTDVLGYLSGVHHNHLGFKCMQLLARLMVSSSGSKDEVIRTLSTVVIESLLRFSSETMNTSYCAEMIRGMVHMFKIQSIVEDVGKVATPLLPSYVDNFIDHVQGDKSTSVRNTAKLLAYATDAPHNVKGIATEELVEHTRGVLDNRSIQEDDAMRDYWLDVLRLAGNLVKYAPEPILQLFVTAGQHARIILRLKNIRAEGSFTEQTAPEEVSDADVLAACIDFVHAISRRQPDVLHDCCKSYRLQRELTELVKMHKQDVSILAASIRMLTIILQDKVMYREHAGFIISECSKFKPMMQYLGGSKYQDLFPNSDSIPLSGIPVDSHVNDVFVAVIEIIKFFALRLKEEQEADDDDDGQAEQVNSFLNEEDRERVLLSLLAVPNDKVKFAVMECINEVDIEQVDLSEISLMIKFIADCQNIGAGLTEHVLALIVTQLRKISSTRHRRGDEFRSFKAQEALLKCYKLLFDNVCRPTFSQDDEEQKLDLSLAIVRLFRCCSQYDSLHDFMRGGHIQTNLCQILKLEQELNHPLARDVAIEQTWMGRSILILMRCFQADDALERYHRVTFRVLSRIADVLEGRTDGFNIDSDDQFLTKDIAARERRAWSTSRTEKNLRYMDDNEYKDRIHQADLFMKMDGLRKIIDFLMDDEALHHVRDYQARMSEASQKIGDFKREAVEKREEVERSLTKQRAKDEIPYVEGMEEEDVEEVFHSGRALLMECMQGIDEAIDEDADSLFVAMPNKFEINERLDDKESYDRNIPVYVIAALLRIIWALITVPPTDSCRTETIRVMRQPKMIMYLLALMQNKPMLSCNLAAKFLNVMTSALDTGVFGHKKAENQRLELCKLLTEYIHDISGMSDGLTKLHKLAKDKPLRSREQQLCSQIARFMGMITRVVPFFKLDLFTDCPESQAEGIAKCIDWIVPAEVVRLCIGMILYELQVDAGDDHGKIDEEFVKLAYQKAGMKDRATRFISQLILRCPAHKYDILEAINAAQVFNNQTVRPSYIWALLGEINLSTYTSYIEQVLPAWSGDEHDRIVQLALVEVPLDSKGNCFTGLICASTLGIYMMKPNDSKPPYKNENDGDRWDPSWEVAWPRDPVKLWTRSYSHIRRIYRCYGKQILAIEWYHPEQIEIMRIANKSNASARKGAPPAQVDVLNQQDIFLFHREQDRERFIACLRRFSSVVNADPNAAQKGEVRTTQVLNDSVIRGEVMKSVEKSQVLAATCAMPLQERLFGETTIQVPHLWVLTTKKIISYSLILNNYQPPSDDEIDFFDEDDFKPHDIGLETDADDLFQPDRVSSEQLPISWVKTQEEFIRAHVGRQGGISRMPSKDAQSKSRWPVLVEVQSWSLPPKDVVFIESAEQPDLKINTSNGAATIRFYDDDGRESWRRALAYYLTKNAGKQWGRTGH